MGGLAIAKVGYGTWLKFVWPVLILLAILTIVVLTVAVLLTMIDTARRRHHHRHPTVQRATREARPPMTQSAAAADPGRLARDDRGRGPRGPGRRQRRGLTNAEVESPARQVRREPVRRCAQGAALAGRSCASTPTRCRSCCSGPASSACSCPGSSPTGIVLILLTLLNAAMGLSQEGKASASVAALQKMMVVKAKVRRDGALVEVPMEDIVPGDIVNIEAGDLVPADGRILPRGDPRDRRVGPDRRERPGPEAGRPRRRGRRARRPGRPGVHEHPGHPRRRRRSSSSRPGWRPRSATSAACSRRPTDEKTPLTKQLNALTNQILIIAGISLAISIGIGLWRDQPFETLFLTAVAFSVSAIPTGLPAVVTAILAAGTATLAASRGHREAPPLGRDAGLDVGHQLRQDRHAHAQPDDRRPDGGRRRPLHDHRRGLLDRGPDQRATAARPTCALDEFMLPMALCADAVVKDGGLVGDPTEGALVVLAAKGGVDPVLTREHYPRVASCRSTPRTSSWPPSTG